jgi:hypothetical protein
MSAVPVDLRFRARITFVVRLLYRLLIGIARLAVWTGRMKELEIVVLRHQLAVLQRNTSNHPSSTTMTVRSLPRPPACSRSLVAVQQQLRPGCPHGTGDLLVRRITIGAQHRVGERAHAGRQHRSVMRKQHVKTIGCTVDQRLNVLVGDRFGRPPRLVLDSHRTVDRHAAAERPNRTPSHDQTAPRSAQSSTPSRSG